MVPVVSRRQDSADALPSTRIDSRMTAGVRVIAAGDAATCWRSGGKARRANFDGHRKLDFGKREFTAIVRGRGKDVLTLL